MLYQLPFIIRNGYKFGKQSKLNCGNNQGLKASAGWNRAGSGEGETLGVRGGAPPGRLRPPCPRWSPAAGLSRSSSQQ